jgi:hypothetical protein
VFIRQQKIWLRTSVVGLASGAIGCYAESIGTEAFVAANFIFTHLRTKGQAFETLVQVLARFFIVSIQHVALFAFTSVANQLVNAFLLAKWVLGILAFVHEALR